MIGVESDELKLHIISLEWFKGAICVLFFNVNFDDDVILDSVILRVDSSPSVTSLHIYKSIIAAYLVVFHLRKLEDTSLLECPLI